MRWLEALVICGSLAVGVPAADAQSKAGKPAPGLEPLYVVDMEETVTSEPWGEEDVSLVPGVPRNWLTPVNYVEGTLHVRLEVLEMQKPFLFFFCLGEEEDPKWKLPGGMAYTFWVAKPGVHKHSFSPKVATYYVPCWDRVAYYCLIIQKSMGVHVHRDPAWWPLLIRLKVCAVPKGGTVDPDFWTAPCGTYGSLHWTELRELSSVAALLRAGAAGRALQEAEKEGASANPKRSQEAKRVLEALKGHVEKRRKVLGDMKLESPDLAIQELGELAKRYLPSPIGKDLAEEAKTWAKDPEIGKTRKAKAVFEIVRVAAADLQGKGKATDPKFASRYAVDIRAIAQGTALLKKEYPATKFCGKAMKIADELAIRIDP